MTSDPRANWLRSVPIFGGLSDSTIERILNVSTELDVARGHVLVRPDEPRAGLFIIEEGRATVELKNRRIEIGEGECFGELALLDESAVHVGRVAGLRYTPGMRHRGIAAARSCTSSRNKNASRSPNTSSVGTVIRGRSAASSTARMRDYGRRDLARWLMAAVRSSPSDHPTQSLERLRSASLLV